MHPALLVPEITDLILSFLQIEDLPRMSQTCKFLHDIAEAQRFRREPNLRALVNLLPKDLVCEGKPKHLQVYSANVAEEARFPLNVSSVLPSHHAIHVEPRPQQNVHWGNASFGAGPINVSQRRITLQRNYLEFPFHFYVGLTLL